MIIFQCKNARKKINKIKELQSFIETSGLKEMLQKGPGDCRYARAHNLKVKARETRKVPPLIGLLFIIRPSFTFSTIHIIFAYLHQLTQSKYTHLFNFKSFLKASVFNIQFPSNNFTFHANIAITCRHITTQFQRAAASAPATTTTASTTRP